MSSIDSNAPVICIVDGVKITINVNPAELEPESNRKQSQNSQNGNAL